MGADEARFSVEYNLDQKSFVWSDKYRPRKPRFFNRVHTVSVSILHGYLTLFSIALSINSFYRITDYIENYIPVKKLTRYNFTKVLGPMCETVFSLFCSHFVS